MNRRNFIQNSALTLGAFTLLPNGIWAKSKLDTPYKIKELRGGVSVFTEKGGTIAYLQSSKGMVVVDSQFPEQSQHLIDELKKQSTTPFKLLINTHHHGDHTGGNISFKGLVEHVVAHENSLINSKNVAQKQKNEEKQLFADVTFKDTWKQKVGKEKIKAHYFGAGHTNGDAVIHFENANVAHLGDLLFNRRYPFVDRSAGANINSWINVLDKIHHTFDNETIFIFGHAFDPEKITGNKEDINAFKDYLEKLLVFVDSEIKAGKSKEEVMKATSVPCVTEWKGDGIVRSLQAAYEELTEKK
ncbi:glyoxylase-like metal-dependent hydrolase (beta-lactamase superfamily II) [Arcicella aurantiaca]|uniref:Glyoxylase-like metal-dependent hydrolase (Beta-lactamase superfamily II) n=1 Tax=Arcicella aurantiaca TaxID=591202 RepID=A0A316E518_9BACT|nr:MBL fold metallo-hydrolase [Arcicella aurantiaca]PWK25176.1 glyoxylase-like metal-dependent hydrolase (beta-lactamase superfamily II) [Arcicella aurantiaca]